MKTAQREEKKHVTSVFSGTHLTHGAVSPWSSCPPVHLNSCHPVLLSFWPMDLLFSCPPASCHPVLMSPWPHVLLASCPPVLLSYCPSVSLTMEKNTRIKGTGDTTSNRIGIGFNHARTITNAIADGLDK